MQIHHHHREHNRQKARENRSRTSQADRDVLTFETLRPYVFYCRFVVRCSHNASLQLFSFSAYRCILEGRVWNERKGKSSRLLFISHRNAQSILFRLVRLLDSVRISTNEHICWFLLHVLRLRHAQTIADSTDSILGIDEIAAAQTERDYFGSGT